MKVRGNKRGIKRHHKPVIAAVAVGALLSFQAGTARADDTAAEIRFLKKRLMQLEEKVAHQDKQIRGVAKFPAMPPDTPIVCKDGPCPPPPPAPPPVFVSFKNGLKVESFDGDFSFKIGGRIFVDGGVSDHPVQAFVGIRPFTFFPAHAGSGFSNQVGFRQARLEVEGKAWRDWYYKLQYDFTGSGNDLIAGGFRDVWLAWQPQWQSGPDIVCKDQDCPPRYITPITFQVGNQFEPSSMERMASSKYRDFLDRAQAADLLAGNRHIGIAANVGGDNVWGFYGKPSWSFKTGLYSTSFEDGNPLGATTNAAGVVTNVGIPAGNSAFLNPVAGGHQYWDAAARLTYAPIRDQEHLLHLGGWVRYQKPNDATATSDDRVLQPGPSVRSSMNILGESLLGTQPLTCVVATAQLVGQNCVKNVLNYGAELEAAWGPFSIQAEYLGIHYDRNPALLTFFNTGGAHAAGGTSINFSGYYVYATWYLTGESRAEQYRSYEEFNAPGGGNVAQIKILNPWSAGGWGAWELAARVDEINLNDGSVGFAQPVGARPNIQGGRQTDFTLGLNWYPDVGVRFMANWVHVLALAAPFNRPDINGIHPNLFEIRAQVDW
ncbi:MAG: porin [Pseudomonadota bacterium]|nr:porin [Pseudomonadota bacterium]